MMDVISTHELPGLFQAWQRVFSEQREFLIALDGKVGDSDLGITMNKAFAAASEAVSHEEAGATIAKMLRHAGVIMAKIAPSTMGTLTATGFIRASKALESASVLGTKEIAEFWRAFAIGVAERGKAKVGDKTLLDVLDPIAASLENAAASGEDLVNALSAATLVAAHALENTKSMVAQHGKAAAFQDKTRGLQDAGATVGFLILQTMRDFVANKTPVR
jgi:dihydroxyacetone kinase-like protein